MLVMPPYHSRRAWLRSFWLVVSVAAGLGCGVLLAVGGHAHALGAGVAIGVALAVPGLIWPHATAMAFRAWNKLARLFANAARLYVTRVCLYTIFPVVGLFGSTMTMDRPASLDTGWARRRFPRTAAYGSTADLDAPTPSNSGWLRDYASWASRSGRPWTLGLVPFLILLSVFEEEAPAIPPDHDIYTLY
jgi:hypothetical protein